MKERFPESQRDGLARARSLGLSAFGSAKFLSPFPKRLKSITQPKVAESARLPWVTHRNDFLPQRGCVVCRVPNRHNPVGVGDVFDSITQGSSFLATAGLIDIAPLGQTRWLEQRRLVSELDALQAEVDALKRLQAETAAELAALLPAILDKAFKGKL